MSAVGIVTISGDTNYGNRLQNYALQEAILSLGSSSVESLEGLPRREDRWLKVQRVAFAAAARRREYLDRLLLRKPQSGLAHDVYVCPAERREAIRQFSTEYVRVAPRASHRVAKDLRLLGRYSHFVVGSDQVWNPAFTHGNAEWFLQFARPEQRIGYAASFGIPEVPRYLMRRYRKGLKDFRALSVREHQAAEIVRGLTGRSPIVVLDPTMLLQKAQWDALAQQPPSLEDGRYIAQFMLSSGDGIRGGGADLSRVRAFAANRSLEIVDLHNPTAPELLALGPLGFVGAIRGAELVVTDSFHAAVFATIFHRPFLLVRRGRMNSRFDSLLRHTGLEGRVWLHQDGPEKVMDLDWDRVDRDLAEVRSRSWEFLADALR